MLMQLEGKWRKGNLNEQKTKQQKTQHNLYIQKKKVKKFTRNIYITASDDKTYSTICYVHLALMLDLWLLSSRVIVISSLCTGRDFIYLNAILSYI